MEIFTYSGESTLAWTESNSICRWYSAIKPICFNFLSFPICCCEPKLKITKIFTICPSQILPTLQYKGTKVVLLPPRKETSGTFSPFIVCWCKRKCSHLPTHGRRSLDPSNPGNPISRMSAELSNQQPGGVQLLHTGLVCTKGPDQNRRSRPRGIRDRQACCCIYVSVQRGRVHPRIPPPCVLVLLSPTSVQIVGDAWPAAPYSGFFSIFQANSPSNQPTEIQTSSYLAHAETGINKCNPKLTHTI